jgi:2'-5' RNA ligase
MNQALLSKQAAEDDTPFPYGTVQAEIPQSSPAAVALTSVRAEIAEKDLAGRGRDIGPPHVTLRYGIQGDDISAIEALLMTLKPFAVTLGQISSFPPSATREVAVVIATIECPELHALHQRLGEVVDFAEPAHEYEPHVTIAYVRPEVAEKYVGNQITAGHRFVVTEVLIRTRSKNEIIVTLNG